MSINWLDQYLERTQRDLQVGKNVDELTLSIEDLKIFTGKKCLDIELPSADHAPKQSWRNYNLIPLHNGYRKFFPDLREPFIFETDVGKHEVWVTSERGEHDGNYICGVRRAMKNYPEMSGLASFYRKHREIEPGTILHVRLIQPFEKYKIEAISLPKDHLVE